MTRLHTITIAGEPIPIVIRKHPRSRRMVIRYQALDHHLSLTLPRYVSIRRGLQFIEEKRGWIEHELKKAPRRVPFKDGQKIPYKGAEYVIRHIGGRGVVSIDTFPLSPRERAGGRDSPHMRFSLKLPHPNPLPEGEGTKEILIPGDAEFLPRRLTEWLKRRAREDINTLAAEKAAAIGVRIKKISLRDTTSRWGSCSHDGNLSFSWRLILAPPEILDYLVSHEVAHIAQHNHSPAFWNLVERLHPDYKKAGLWLKRHGQGLYVYG